MFRNIEIWSHQSLWLVYKILFPLWMWKSILKLSDKFESSCFNNKILLMLECLRFCNPFRDLSWWFVGLHITYFNINLFDECAFSHEILVHLMPLWNIYNLIIKYYHHTKKQAKVHNEEWTMLLLTQFISMKIFISDSSVFLQYLNLE